MDPTKVARYKSLHQALFVGSIALFVFLAFGSVFTIYSLPLAIVTLVWFLLGFRVVGTKERWVIKMFHDPYAVADSGLRWLPFLISSGDKFPTVPEQLDFPELVQIVTKPGTVDGVQYGTMTVKCHASLMYRYPKDDNLLKTAKILPSPENREALINYFQEPVFDELRTTGGDFVYIDLQRKKGDFEEQVTATLKNKDGLMKRLIDEAGIIEPQVIVKGIEFPEDVMAALPAEEVARLKGRATRVQAEAEGDQKRTIGKAEGDAAKSKGEGVRDAQKMLYDMIRKHPENLKIKGLFVLSEMAQGPATTIFPIPTNLMNDLKDVLGNSKSVGAMEEVWNKLPKNVQDRLLAEAIRALKPEPTKT